MQLLHLLLLVTIVAADDYQLANAFPTSMRQVLLSAQLTIEELYNFDASSNSFESVVELLLTVNGADIDAPELRTLREDESFHPFGDVHFSALSASLIGATRQLAKSAGTVVALRQRFHLKSLCRLNSDYPFDRQVCDIRLVTGRLPARQLDLRWVKPGGIVLSQGLSLPDMSIDSLTPVMCRHESVFPNDNKASSSVRHGCLAARLSFSRPLLGPLIRLFLPSAAAIALTWLSFYVDRTMVTARIALLAMAAAIVTVVTLCVNHPRPEQSHVTPVDQWMLICGGCVALAIVELFLVIVFESWSRKERLLSRRSDEVRERSRQRRERVAARCAQVTREKSCDAEGGSYDLVLRGEFVKRADRFSVSAARLDLLARCVCPLVFLLSTAIYFFIHAVHIEKKTH